MPETIIWSQPITFTETAKGAPGPAGAPGPQYGLRCDTSSIMRELDTKESETSTIAHISPSSISFVALKNTGDTDNPVQEIVVCENGYEIRLYKSIFDSNNGGQSEIIDEGITYFDGATGSQTQPTKYDKIQLDLSSYTRNGINSNASAIKAQLLYKTLVGEEVQAVILVELSIPIVLSNNLLELAQIDGTKVKISEGRVYAESIVAEAITGDKIKAGSITSTHLASNQLDSLSPPPKFPDGDTSGNFYTEEGAQIRLSRGGSIHFQNFYIGDNGDVGVRGHIEAKSGAILGRLTIGESEEIFLDGTPIGKGENARNIFQVLDYFYVRSDGYVMLKNGQIAGWEITENAITAQNRTVGLSSVWAADGENPLRFFAGKRQGSNDYNFQVYNNGDLYAQQANLTSGYIYGNFYVGQNGQTQGITIDGINGDISTSQFASGAYGWRIDQNGNAEFNNATIRGKLTSVIFEKQTVSAVNGDLYIAPSYVLKKELLASVSIDKKTNIVSIPFTKPTGFPWQNGTQVLLSFSQEDNVYNNIMGQFSEETKNGVTTIAFTFPQLPIPTPPENIPQISTANISSDIQIIAIGTTEEKGIQYKYIYLTANANNSPFIDVQDYYYKSEGENPLPKVRMGRLDGITDTMNGFGTLSGYGFYCSNAYLTGELNLPQAGITNQITVGFNGTSYNDGTTEGQRIRLWAGGTSKPADGNTDIAPFIVTQDGSLYASKGVFKGQIIATNSTFSGTISAAGIIVEKGGKGYDPTIAKNHFFVGYKKEPTSFDDYVLDMSSAGLSIWEGGFRAYSDILSGWDANNEKDETKAMLPYGYTSNNKRPFPYLAAIDEGRFSTREWHNIGISVDGDNYKTTSILAREGKLFFSSNSISKNDDSDYISVEKNAYDMTKNIYLGLQDNKLQIHSNTGITIDGGRVQVETDLYIKEIANIGGVSIRKATAEGSVDTIGLNFIFE